MALAALSLALLWAPSTDARVLTLGPSSFPATNAFKVCFGAQFGCPVGYTLAQEAPAGMSVAPANGIITSWEVAEYDSMVPDSLLVLERAPGGGWRVAGESFPAINTQGGQNPTYLPINAGDLIGVNATSGQTVAVVERPGPGFEAYEWAEPPLAGSEARNPAYQEPEELELNAQVELTPVVTSVSPASGSTLGGNTVTLTGKYLESVVNVVFGSTPATRFSVDPAGEHITAVVPSSAAGTVDVHVSTLLTSSESVAGDRYTFVAPATQGSSAPPPGGSGGSTTASPTVTGFSESTARWRLGSSLPHISSTPVGTAFAFVLNEPASVALTFSRVLSGRRADGRCVAPSHANRSKPKCNRNVTVGSLALSGHAGLNTVRFQGRLSSAKKLPPGSYTASITMRDGRGLKTLTRSLTFTIVP